MSKRYRKIHYEIDKYDTEYIENIKKIECKYHIFSITESSTIYGFIYFENGRSMKKIEEIFSKQITIHPGRIFNRMDFSKWTILLEIGNPPAQGSRRGKQGIVNQFTENTIPIRQTDEICQYLMKQNQQLLEENRSLKLQPVTINNHYNNIENKIENAKIENKTTKIENKTTNINVFLNEECKNAVTLVEFVNSLKIEDEDLFFAKENGLAAAITNIFERGLKEYDINTRPLHCTDAKRETLHIKQSTGWIKEHGPESNTMKSAITHISNRKITKLSHYVKAHPEFENVESPKYEDCLQLMRGVMGADEDPDKTEKKVLKNIAKSVYISGQ